MKEIWTDVIGYEGLYKVSTWGHIKNKDGNLLTPYKNYKGYLKVGLMRNGINSKHRVHRIVAKAFIPNTAGYSEVNHKGGNKENNSVTNLEWVSGNRNREYESEFQLKVHFDAWLCRMIAALEKEAE